MPNVKDWELSEEELDALPTATIPDDDGGSYRDLLGPETIRAAQNAKSIREMVQWLRWELARNTQLLEAIAMLNSAAIVAGYAQKEPL